MRGWVPALWVGIRTLFTALTCLGAGAGAARLGVPLAWILGPMIAAAALSLSGVRYWFPQFGQRIGQWTIGCSVGLKLTGAALALLAPLIPLMILFGLLGMVAGAVASLILVRFARLDPYTAYFAMMPGGLAEMANIAATVGARGEPVALTQALRLAIVVCVLPPVVLALGTPGEIVTRTAGHDIVPAQIGAVLAAGLVGVFFARFLRFNNYWMIGAMLGSGAVSATGLIAGSMPGIIVHGAQLLLGIAIGARFKRDIVARLLGIAAIAVVAILAVLTLLICSGLLLSVLTHGDLSTAVLATAPGGLPEMAVTAQVLHLDVAFVTVFQLVRAFLVNGVAVGLMKGLERVGFFRAAGRER